MKRANFAYFHRAAMTGALTAVVFAGWPLLASAGVTLASAELPPESDPPDCEHLLSHYWGGPSSYTSGPPTADFGDLSLRCFEGVVRTTLGADELQTFQATLITTVDFGGGPRDVTLTGPMQTIAYGKAGVTTGVFDTEVISMSLLGTVPGVEVLLRESPTLASAGQTTILEACPGIYDVSSFFDVFTELSVDAGQTWVPVDASQSLTLGMVAPGGVRLASAELPPESDPPDCEHLLSHYWGGPSSYTSASPMADFADLSLRCFEGVVRITLGADELQTYQATLITKVDIGAGAEDVTLTGQMQTIAYDKAGVTFGVFDTEIVSMTLLGMVSGIELLLQESPTLASAGQTTIVESCGALHEIYSFYDLFSELSVDGGLNWLPVDASQDLTVIGLPLFADGFESGDMSRWSSATP
jgi:hypothetical protein